MILQNKTIILTGAKRIGQAVAKSLGEKGANIAVVYRSSKDEAEAICKQSSKAQIFQADLSKEEDIKRLITEVKAAFGQIDGLVHMAANYPKVPLKEVTMENFTQTQQIIAGSSLLLAKYISKQLQKNPKNKIKGKIIFFSDWSVLRKPYPEYLSYNMAKAGIDSLVFALAKQLAPDITVNAISPGPMIKPPDLTKEENKEALAGTPLNRWGGGEVIAQAVVSLLENDFITGVILPVDGGRTIG